MQTITTIGFDIAKLVFQVHGVVDRLPEWYFLRNRFYIGEVKYGDEVLRGEQEPILDRKLFDAVQCKLDAQLKATLES
jgi:hypothetical protein